MISLKLQEIGVEFADLILCCVAWGTVVAPEERLLVLTEPVIGGGRSAVRLGMWTILGTALASEVRGATLEDEEGGQRDENQDQQDEGLSPARDGVGPQSLIRVLGGGA